MILVIMGVSGCGKSTVAGLLAGKLGWDLREGDDLHPAVNVAKMASGTPLTDEDRWPWLALIADWIDAHIAAGTSGIVTCSALRRSYRDVLRRDEVVFVHLAGSRTQIEERLTARLDHFMPTSLLDSQFATLEPLQRDEQSLTVDIGRSSAALVDEIAKRLDLEGNAVRSAR